MFVVDLEAGASSATKSSSSPFASQPYGAWLEKSKDLGDLPPVDSKTSGKASTKTPAYHGYTKEELERVLFPCSTKAKKPSDPWARTIRLPR